jgi:YD repeat-containing protein
LRAKFQPVEVFYAYAPLTGNLERLTDRNGRVTEYSYDNQHRQTKEEWRDSVGGPVIRTIASTYDLADQLTAVGDADSAYGYTLDGLGRATTITNAGTPGSPAVVLTQQFDQLSRRTGLSTTIGVTPDFVNAYQYDALSRLRELTQTDVVGGNAVADKRVVFNYNLIGQFTSIQRYGDLLGELVVNSVYSYELGTQRLSGLRYLPPAGADLANYAWTYDALGRVRTFFSANDSQDTASYFYDKTDQLTAVTHNVLTTENENYGYDLSGNRTDGQFDSDPNNRLAGDGTFTYAYDAEGNLITRTRVSNAAADDKTTLYKWDHRNRLIEVEFKNNGEATTKRVVYTYDVYDRRIGKAVDTTAPFNMVDAQVERYVYDGAETALVFNGAGALKTRYLHGPMIDQILADESFGPGKGPGKGVRARKRCQEPFS